MSDLVERVARALCAREWRRCGASDALIARKVDEEWWEFEPQARAAIKAVAEWGQNNFYDDKPLEEFLGELLAQLKEGSE